MRRDETRLAGNCLPTAQQGFIQLGLLQERTSQIVVRFRIVRPERQGLAIRGDSLFQPSLILQRQPQIAVADRIGRQRGDRFADEFNGDLVPSLLVRDQPQVMQGVWLIRGDAERLSVEDFRLTQVPRLMMLKRSLQSLCQARFCALVGCRMPPATLFVFSPAAAIAWIVAPNLPRADVVSP